MAVGGAEYDIAALVYPGYHPEPRWKELGLFPEGLRRAKDWCDRNTPPGYPKLISINAWNEWIEGSYLEPDEKHGMGYLEAIRRVFVR